MEHPCKQEKEITRLGNENIAQQSQIDERVKWTMFWAILLVIFSILGTVVSNVYSQLDAIVNDEQSFHKEVDNKVNETKIAQAKIDVQYADIMSKLAEINSKLSKIK